jgi:hypothetical protein
MLIKAGHFQGLILGLKLAYKCTEHRLNTQGADPPPPSSFENSKCLLSEVSS